MDRAVLVRTADVEGVHIARSTQLGPMQTIEDLIGRCWETTPKKVKVTDPRFQRRRITWTTLRISFKAQCSGNLEAVSWRIQTDALFQNADETKPLVSVSAICERGEQNHVRVYPLCTRQTALGWDGPGVQIRCNVHGVPAHTAQPA